MSDADLIAAWLARNSKSICPPSRKLRPKADAPVVHETLPPAIEQEERALALRGYEWRLEELLRGYTGPELTVEQWAARDIDVADPHRDIAEAAALVEICNIEGAASARLFEKELCGPAR